jgi:hypothetical protein
MPNQPTTIVVEIGTLELPGFNANDARRVATALGSELERLLRQNGLPHMTSDTQLGQIAGELAVGPGARPEAMGMAAAQAIYMRLRE